MFTIVYYSSNREDEKFERKIVKNILDNCGDIPIISVTHKPMDFGLNICVGEHEPCNHNLFRQILIGASIADSKFIISAEADCLYPPDYFQLHDQFQFKTKYECYKCDNQYVLNEWGKGEYSGYYKKHPSVFAQVTGRDHLIDEIRRVLKNRPIWDKRRMNERPLELFRRLRWKTFHIDNPVISLKTRNGMSIHTKIIEPPVDTVSYWGDAIALRERIFHEN